MSDVQTTPKPKRRPKTAKVEKSDELAGLSATECAAACRKGHCVIMRNGMCGHPYKASHSHASADQNARILRARKLIAHQKIDIRG